MINVSSNNLTDYVFYRKVQWCYLDLVTSNLVTTSALVSINLPHKSFAFCDIICNLVTVLLEIKSVTK